MRGGIMEQLFDWKYIGSLFATIMFARSYIRNILPPELYNALTFHLSKIFSALRREAVINIKQFHNSCPNDCFEAVEYYIGSKSVWSALVLELSKTKTSENLTNTTDASQIFEETYKGCKVKWSLHNSCGGGQTTNRKASSSQLPTGQINYYHAGPSNYYELSFMERYKEKVQSSYIPYVMEVAEKIKSKNRKRHLYTNGGMGEYYGREGLWSNVPLSHPSTFDTIAIDPILRDEIKEDLMKFANRKEYYNRVGRAWKRGYLLYGPPGTGKTSLIAAIANFLDFDIYDLELASVTSNAHLRKLLISTTSKSVIIVEDIDCSVDLPDRNKKPSIVKPSTVSYDENEIEHGLTYSIPRRKNCISLSGVLNFADGLWSSCGEERLMIFTTNHKEKIDPALLRPRRMDKHINFSYCEIEAFKILMKNYLGVNQHELVKQVEEMLPLVKMTPADIAEVFMSCEEDGDMGMNNMVEVMKKRLVAME